MDRAKKFYGEVFGWSLQDWSEYEGMPYLTIMIPYVEGMRKPYGLHEGFFEFDKIV